MRKKTWWVVVSHSGQYDDYRACAVVVYPDPVAANEHANAATAWARRWWEKHRDDFETADWDNPSTTLPEPKSPFDRYLGRSEASDVTYGVREMEVRSSVPKVGKKKSVDAGATKVEGSQGESAHPLSSSLVPPSASGPSKEKEK